MNFGLIGASGYIAKRHVQAIKHINGDLLMLADPHDNVGYIDGFFPNASYYREIERFDRNLDRLYQEGNAIDYVSICTPNYLHDSHIRLALRNNSNVICEKPLVLKTEHLMLLKNLEDAYGKKINTILQLRHHEKIINLKKRISNSSQRHQVKIKYITPRGNWYDYSWKGTKDKSGGILFNIGIHFFDMLIWVFGSSTNFNVTNKNKKSFGNIQLEKADVTFELSIDYNDLPYKDWTPFRSITIDGEELDFSVGFTELHNTSYEHIINNRGYGIDDIFQATDLIEKMTRNE